MLMANKWNMKTLLLGFVFTMITISNYEPFPTIILINGEAHLVYLDEEYIVEVLQTVPYYFSSNLTHEEIVAGLIEQKEKKPGNFYASNEDRFISKDEIDVLENAEFIRFIPQKALLDRVAVNRIREIAEDYVDGGISNIKLNIIYKNTSISQLLTDNRLNSVKDLLVAFGVNENAITTQKDLREKLDNNPFVRINYKKDLR